MAHLREFVKTLYTYFIKKKSNAVLHHKKSTAVAAVLFKTDYH